MAIQDGKSIGEAEALNTDVCIVGAGAAGISLAHEFRDQGFAVVVLEAGGDGFDLETQSFYKGEVTGRSYYPLDTCRLRYLGGTTNHWTNWCSAFDEEDFEVRPWIPHSGWPFTLSELDSAYERAHKLTNLGPYEWDDMEFWTTPGGGKPLAFEGTGLQTRTIQIGTPRVPFGHDYREVLEKGSNIRTVTGANVTELEFATDSNRIQRAQVKTLAGNAFSVEARLFVLAAGGIENPRLLLASRSSRAAGIGNDRDLVGRFFMEHINQYLGRLLLSDPSIDMTFYTRKRPLHGTRAHGYVRLRKEVLRREKLPGFSMYLKEAYSEDVAPGIDSARILRTAYQEGRLPDDLGTHLWNVVTDIDDLAEQLYRRYYSGESLQGHAYRITTRVEQRPNPDSRVVLSDQLDPFGAPLANLDWRLLPEDYDAVVRGQGIAASEFAAAGTGRVKFLEFDPTANTDQDEDHLFGGCHHMGTTRISHDPQFGVADPNCRVFGTDNLYLAGSSVFPTSGQCNPTLSIVAMAVRLADHIKGELA